MKSFDKYANMFKKEFIELVNESVTKAKDFYSMEKNVLRANPFYIGFGNPNADVLIFGKEKGFDLSDKNAEALEFESINNSYEWDHYVKNSIASYQDRFVQRSTSYLNSYYPYSDKMKPGHTWTKYGLLTNLLYPELGQSSNDFLSQAFITEVNHEPSKYSVIKNFTFGPRLDFLSHRFYRSFGVTILACGKYLSIDQIEETFDVKFLGDSSKPHRRLVVFTGQGRILINTRQLSMNVSMEYLKKIFKKIGQHRKSIN